MASTSTGTASASSEHPSAQVSPTSIRAQLAAKGKWYWLGLLFAVSVGAMGGEWVSDLHFWVRFKYRLYQFLQKFPHEPTADNTVVVTIGDEEYWNGELQRRVPVKRDYLAKLVQALDKLDPAVIALDFDLRGEPARSTNYAKETETLVAALKAAAENRHVVVAKTIWLDEKDNYVLEPDVIDGSDLGKVTRGYIALPRDELRIALTIPLKGGGSIDSLSEAVVRARKEEVLRRLPSGDKVLFAGYLPTKSFTTMSGKDILGRDQARKSGIAHQIVIVGAGWHTLGYNRGRLVDVYPTPAGLMGGVFIHANYIEALLNRRVYSPMARYVAFVLEMLALGALAVGLIVRVHWGWKVFFFLICTAVVLAISFVAFTSFGVFYDFFPLLFLVVIHYAFEVIRGWRRDARLYRANIPRQGGT
jgi:CHASE2 domain-containing sensor protein